MKDSNKIKNNLKIRKIARVRSRLSGTAECPRVAVFKSLKHLSVQAINDAQSKTLAMVSDRHVKAKTKLEQAASMGQELSKKLLAMGVKRGVFDRRHYQYHGQVQAIAEGLRVGGFKI